MTKGILLSVSALTLFAGASFAQSLPSTYSTGDATVIEQVGASNTIGGAGITGIDQQASSGASNWAGIYQGVNVSGSSNSATVQQVAGSGATNASLIIQDGSDNQADTQQNTSAAPGASSHTVTFTVPSFTFLTDAQGDTRTLGGVSPSPTQPGGQFISEIQQKGNDQATVNQGIWGSAAATGSAFSQVAQLGSNAYVEVSQFGETNNWSSVTQTGTANNAYSITQVGGAGNNVSTLVQAGRATALYITQTANAGNNTSYLNQTGGYTTISQNANSGSNSSGVYESSGSATVIQNGFGSGSNRSLIWQSGGNVSVQQTNLGSGGNSSTVVQTGADFERFAEHHQSNGKLRLL